MTKLFRIQSDGTAYIGDAELNVSAWKCGESVTAAGAQSATAQEVFTEIGRSSSLRHLVVGVIGPREATAGQMEAAEQIGSSLGRMGLTLICGGKSGVMEAVSKGCSEAGGTMIGILPGSTPHDANRYVSIALPTGLGEARNMVIAKSARVLIAVGGSYGTLSEVAYGLHFSKPVIGIQDAPDVEGVLHAKTADEAIELALAALLNSALAAGEATNV